MRRKLIAGLLTALSVTMVCPAAYASTEHYTDSSVVGADSGWSDWDAAWETTAADFTKVSLTPGADDTQLNFAWYSEKGDSDATPVVHFGTDKDNLETFEGTAGDVDQSFTGDKAYEYNHVTVTGLEPNTTYYYTVEKNGEQTEVSEYKTQGTDSVKILYVGDPQIRHRMEQSLPMSPVQPIKQQKMTVFHGTVLSILHLSRIRISTL